MPYDADPFGLNDPDPTAPDPTAPDPTESDLVTSAVLASWLGLTTSRVLQLSSDGVLQRVTVQGRIMFPHRASVLAYCESTRSAAARRAANPDMDAAKLALTEANARKVELQNDKASGDLLPIAQVRNEWLGIVTDLRGRLLAIPQRVAANLSLDRAVLASLDAEIRAALADLVADTTRGADSAPLAGAMPVSTSTQPKPESPVLEPSYAL